MVAEAPRRDPPLLCTPSCLRSLDRWDRWLASCLLCSTCSETCAALHSADALQTHVAAAGTDRHARVKCAGSRPALQHRASVPCIPCCPPEGKVRPCCLPTCLPCAHAVAAANQAYDVVGRSPVRPSLLCYNNFFDPSWSSWAKAHRRRAALLRCSRLQWQLCCWTSVCTPGPQEWKARRIRTPVLGSKAPVLRALWLLKLIPRCAAYTARSSACLRATAVQQYQPPPAPAQYQPPAACTDPRRAGSPTTRSIAAPAGGNVAWRGSKQSARQRGLLPTGVWHKTASQGGNPAPAAMYVTLIWSKHDRASS